MQAQLVAMAQQGDREAFSTLASAAATSLFATVRLILHQPDRAEDAVQDALVQAWRDIRGLRDPERLDAWLDPFVRKRDRPALYQIEGAQIDEG